MKGKNLIILVVVALALIAAAVLTSQKQEPLPPAAVGKPVLPDLAVNNVETLAVRSEAGTVTVARVADAWVVPSRYNYPANFGKVREMLLKLADLKIGQVVAVADSQRAALKMVAPGAAAATGVVAAAGSLIELQGAGGKVLAALLVGAEHAPKAGAEAGGFGGYPDGTYVSPDAGKTVYLVADVLQGYGVSARDWMETELLNVSSADIEAITISGRGRGEVQLARKDGAGQLEVQGMAGDEEADASKVSAAESALSYLRFDDVADPALSDEQLGMTNAIAYRAVTKKGEIYTVTVGGTPTNSVQRYVRVAVALKPEEKPAAAGPPPAAAVTAAAGTNAAAKAAQPADANAAPAGTNVADKAARDAEAAKAAAAAERKQLEATMADLEKKVRPWTYIVESGKGDAFTAARGSLVKKKEVKKAEEKQEESKTEQPK